MQEYKLKLFVMKKIIFVFAMSNEYIIKAGDYELNPNLGSFGGWTIEVVKL